MARGLVEVEVDADHEVQRAERGVQAAGVRRAERRVARDGQQRADLARRPASRSPRPGAATGSSPNASGSPRTRLAAAPSGAPRPRPGSPVVFARPAAASGTSRRPGRSRLPVSDVQHVDEPAGSGAEALRRRADPPVDARRVGARRGRARAGGSSSASMPQRAGDRLGREVRGRARATSSSPSTCPSASPSVDEVLGEERVHHRQQQEASVPGRMARCSSASCAVRVRRGSTTTTRPPRARIARSRPGQSGAVIEAAVGGHRVGAEHEQVVRAVQVGHRHREPVPNSVRRRPAAWAAGRRCWREKMFFVPSALSRRRAVEQRGEVVGRGVADVDGDGVAAVLRRRAAAAAARSPRTPRPRSPALHPVGAA